MSVKSGQAVTALFTTHAATTGAATDATGTPAGTLYVNGTSNAASVTVTKITTGVYKAAVTLPSLSAGDIVDLRIAATVAAVAGEGIVWSGVADTKRVSELNDVSTAQVNAEADAALSDAGVTTTVTGRIDAAVSSRMATFTYTAPLDAAGTRTAVGLASANLDTQLADVPTVAEMNARTLVAANYFDPAADTVAAVTTVGSVTSPVTAGTVSDKTGYALSSAGIQAIWDALTSALTTANSIGKRIVDNLDAAITSRMATFSYTAPLDAAGTRAAVGLASADLDTQIDTLATAASLSTVAGYVDTEVAAIKAKTDLIPASPAAVGSAMTLSAGAITSSVIATNAIDADAIATDAVTELQSGMATAAALSTLSGLVDDLESRLTATRAGYLDNLTNLDAAVSTRMATFSPATPLDAAGTRSALGLASANLDTQLGDIPTVTEMNARTLVAANYFDPAADTVAVVTTVGSVTTKTGYELTAAYDAAKTAASQTSVNDLPTNAELATALGTADDAVLSAISALNNLSSAGAQAAAAAALAAYNAATESDVTGLSIPTAATVADAVWDEALAGHAAAGSAGEKLAGAGGGSGLDASGVRAALGLASANLDTQLDALPTNAELSNAVSPLATAANLATLTGYVDTEVAAILADTNELQTNQGAWATATGFSTLDAAGVRTAVGLSAANLDTQLGDLPTVAEMNARTLVAANYFDPAADTVTNVTTVGSVTSPVTAGTVSDKTGYALSSAGVQAIWDALTTAMTAANSIGKRIVDNLNAAITSRMATFVPATPLDAAGTRSALGLASANLDTQLDALPTNTELSNAVSPLATAANLATVDSIVDAILVDTNELQTNQGAWATATGFSTLDAAGVRTAVGLSAANLDTQLGDLPTNAELATALGTADDATLSAISGLNNLSAAQVNTQVDQALADVGLTTTVTGRIDAATSTRMATFTPVTPPDSAAIQAAAEAALLAYDAATGGDVSGLSIPTAAGVADAVWDETMSGHTTNGTAGKTLSNAASGGSGGGSTAADIWAFAGARTLTVPACAASGTELTGAAITGRRGDSFSISFTGLSGLGNRSALWFTAKTRASHADSEAQLQVTEADGLLISAGATATAANGSLTVTDDSAGNITVVIDEAETAKMPVDRALAYDIQMLTTGDNVVTLAVGTLTFEADVTRAVA